MNELLAITTKTFISIFVFLAGMFSGAVSFQPMPPDTWVDQLLGPLGALAFAIIAIGFLVRYLQRKEKRVDDLQDRLLEEAQKEAEFWREKANKD